MTGVVGPPHHACRPNLRSAKQSRVELDRILVPAIQQLQGYANHLSRYARPINHCPGWECVGQIWALLWGVPSPRI